MNKTFEIGEIIKGEDLIKGFSPQSFYEVTIIEGAVAMREVGIGLEDGEIELPEEALYQLWDDFLDEANPEVRIGNLSYLPHRVLKEVDPTAYRVGFGDWLDGEIQGGVIVEKDDKYYYA